MSWSNLAQVVKFVKNLMPKVLGHPALVVVATTSLVGLAGLASYSLNPANGNYVSSVTNRLSSITSSTGSNENTKTDGGTDPTSGADKVATPGADEDGVRRAAVSPVTGLALVASPAQPHLGPNSQTEVTISRLDGQPMGTPSVKAGPGIGADIDYSLSPPPLNFSGGVWEPKAWVVTVYSENYNSSGTSNLVFTTQDGGSITIPVSWTPIPGFDAAKGALTRTDGIDTITYTATFTLQPNANFTFYGAPTIHYYVYFGAGACTNTPQLTQYITYSGQTTFSLDCVVARRPPWQPGTPLPPAPTALTLGINVEAILPNGNSIYNYPAQFTYTSTQIPYDQ